VYSSTVRGYLLSLSLAPALSGVCLAAGCTSMPEGSSCTLIGCESQLVVRYSTPLSGDYTLAISGSYSAQVSCPSSGGGSLAPGDVIIQCDASSFTLTSAGDQPLGTNAANAPSITLTVTLTRAAGGTAASDAPVTATVTTSRQPNGPGCGPTCFERDGTLTVTP
jgi:hypothetical protein